jgi:hypothetical protein
MPMDYFTSVVRRETKWYLVCSDSGARAVISDEDLVELVYCGHIHSVLAVSFEAGRLFESNRARAGYMSTTCRLKSGESDRVG